MGVYHYGGREVLRAWGYVGESHCRYTVVRRMDGTWGDVRRGCPDIQVLHEADVVVGLRVRAGDGEGVTFPTPVG